MSIPIPPDSPFSSAPNAEWKPKPTHRFQTMEQAHKHILAIEEQLRTNKAMVDALCIECAELRKDKARLDWLEQSADGYAFQMNDLAFITRTSIDSVMCGPH